MVQQVPDAGVEIARHPAQGAEAQSVLQPAAPLGQLSLGSGHGPAHPPAHIQLLLALQGGLGVLQVGEHGPQPALDGVGRLVAEGFKGVARAEIGFGGQFTGEQQQQLAQLQGEAATEQVWLAAGQAIEGQQQFLLQHPLPAVLTAEPLDHPGDAGAALGCADPGIAGVVPPHHHLLLAHQQVDEGILQLGMHQVEGPSDPSHHVPVGFGQGAAVDLLEQIPQSHGLVAGGPLQAGIGPQAPHQLLQHLPLFLQGRTAPEPLCQFGDADVVAL